MHGACVCGVHVHCMCVCVLVCVYVCMFIHVCVVCLMCSLCMVVCVLVYVLVCVCWCVCVGVCVLVCVCVCVCVCACRHVVWTSNGYIHMCGYTFESFTSSVSDVLVWTNDHMIQWLDLAGLRQFSGGLKESGVHGGVVALDNDFDHEKLAVAMGVPLSSPEVSPSPFVGSTAKHPLPTKQVF